MPDGNLMFPGKMPDRLFRIFKDHRAKGLVKSTDVHVRFFPLPVLHQGQFSVVFPVILGKWNRLLPPGRRIGSGCSIADQRNLNSFQFRDLIRLLQCIFQNTEFIFFILNLIGQIRPPQFQIIGGGHERTIKIFCPVRIRRRMHSCDETAQDRLFFRTWNKRLSAKPAIHVVFYPSGGRSTGISRLKMNLFC